MLTPRLNILVQCLITDEPYEGRSKKSGRRFAQVPVGGFIGGKLVSFSVSLPENMTIEPFKAGDAWEFPIAMLEADDKRNVYFKVRSDAAALKMLRKIDPAALGVKPSHDDDADGDEDADEDGVLS